MLRRVGHRKWATASCSFVAPSKQLANRHSKAQRHYFSIFSQVTQFASERNLSKVRDAIAGSSDERKIVEYLKALTAVSATETIKAIERGWENGKMPVSEPIIREYIKAAASLQKLDSVNITGLLAMINQKASGVPMQASAANSTALNTIIASGSRFSAGSSPTDPLYIQRPEPSWKASAWSLAKTILGLVVTLTFIGAVLDEKGAAGIAGRMTGTSTVIHQAEHSDKTFDDVVGVDEAKAELQEIVMYLKNPKLFTRLGGKLPKGILLTGPPGTGKTLLARAIAGEAGVPFFYSSGSEFEEMYVGVGARRVRDLFEAAKAKSPCIIFIDEIDAIGGSRQLKEQSAMKMTLNQLLVEMDGFEQNNGVIVIAATNFPDSLDSALVRPGRLDKHVDVPMPDIGGRKAILDLYAKKIPMGTDVDMEQLARGTPGFSGAELSNLVNQAAIKASVDGLKAVGMQALEYAKDKIMMGAERKSAIISADTMRMTAFHEAGHALVAILTEGADPVHKATIMPRGRALGMVMQLPDGDQTSMSRKQMLARLDVCMGGRVAEELVFGYDNVTSGASNDIMQATRLAKAMVTKYGLSDKVGIIFLDDKAKTSGGTQKDVDEEVRAILQGSYDRAKELLSSHKADLEKIAVGLMEYESLSGGEIVDLMAGKIPNVQGIRSQRASREAKPIPARRTPPGQSGSGRAPSFGTQGNKGAAEPAPAASRSAGGPLTVATPSPSKAGGTTTATVVPVAPTKRDDSLTPPRATSAHTAQSKLSSAATPTATAAASAPAAAVTTSTQSASSVGGIAGWLLPRSSNSSAKPKTSAADAQSSTTTSAPTSPSSAAPVAPASPAAMGKKMLSSSSGSPANSAGSVSGAGNPSSSARGNGGQAAAGAPTGPSSASPSRGPPRD